MEWLKFEKATLDKPEVFQIAGELGIDPDAVIGKLLRVWSWFDSQSVDGNANVTVTALLDRYAGITGFCKAMKNAGWMMENEDQISLPNYHRHTGSTAKARALGAARTNKSRELAACNGHSVTKTLQDRHQIRKEKNRSDKNRSTMIGDTDLANAIYQAYPKKVGKSDALKAIRKIKDSTWPWERILGAVKTYAECVSRWPEDERQYIPNPATWFNRGSYEDDPATWERKPRSTYSHPQRIKSLDELEPTLDPNAEKDENGEVKF